MKIEYRQIKFRVRNTKRNEWVHPPHEMASLDGVNLLGETILLGGFMDGFSIEDLNEIVPLQYSGIRDCKGKEIFEGDILLMPQIDPESTSGNAIFVVEFKYGTFGYTDTFTKKFEPIYGLIGNTDKDAEATVIGNIYDNPELLK